MDTWDGRENAFTFLKQSDTNGSAGSRGRTQAQTKAGKMKQLNNFLQISWNWKLDTGNMGTQQAHGKIDRLTKNRTDIYSEWLMNDEMQVRGMRWLQCKGEWLVDETETEGQEQKGRLTQSSMI